MFGDGDGDALWDWDEEAEADRPPLPPPPPQPPPPAKKRKERENNMSEEDGWKTKIFPLFHPKEIDFINGESKFGQSRSARFKFTKRKKAEN